MISHISWKLVKHTVFCVIVCEKPILASFFAVVLYGDDQTTGVRTDTNQKPTLARRWWSVIKVPLRTYRRKALRSNTKFYHCFHCQKNTKLASNLSVSRAAQKLLSVSPGEISKVPNCFLLIALNGFPPLALKTQFVWHCQNNCSHCG